MNRFLIAALVLAAAILAYASPSQAQTNACSGGGVQGMLVGGSSGACYYLTVNSDGSINTTASGGGTITTITNPVGVKGADGSAITSSSNPFPTVIVPSATIGVSTQSCTVACASTLISGAHSVYGISGSATVTGWILVYDATSCAANGTVTPKKAYPYTVANSPIGISWGSAPLINATGIAVCFSTTGPYTATASTTAFLSVDYK